MESEIIKAWVNDGLSIFGKHRSCCVTVFCKNKDHCDMYKARRCCIIDGFTAGCPYGHKNVEDGVYPGQRRTAIGYPSAKRCIKGM